MALPIKAHIAKLALDELLCEVKQSKMGEERKEKKYAAGTKNEGNLEIFGLWKKIGVIYFLNRRVNI